MFRQGAIPRTVVFITPRDGAWPIETLPENSNSLSLGLCNRRQTQREACTPSLVALDAHPTAVRFHVALDDAQSQPGPRHSGSQNALPAVERFKNVRQVRRINAWAAVLNRDLDFVMAPVCNARGADAQPSPGGGILDRIRKQVLQRAFNRRRFRQDERQV